MQEEQFGPLVPIATWSTVQEVEDYVMSSHYGQQATTPASRNTQCNRACPCRKRESNHARRATTCYCFTVLLMLTWHRVLCWCLQAAVFSKGTDAAEVASLLDLLTHNVARVNLNCQCQRSPDSFPFTGRKSSALGTLSVRTPSHLTQLVYLTNAPRFVLLVAQGLLK